MYKNSLVNHHRAVFAYMAGVFTNGCMNACSDRKQKKFIGEWRVIFPIKIDCVSDVCYDISDWRWIYGKQQ